MIHSSLNSIAPQLRLGRCCVHQMDGIAGKMLCAGSISPEFHNGAVCATGVSDPGRVSSVRVSCGRTVDPIRDSRIAMTSANKPCVDALGTNRFFDCSSRKAARAKLDLAPTLAVFASRFVISTPPRFAKDYSAPATLAVFVETLRLRISYAARGQGVSRKPC